MKAHSNADYTNFLDSVMKADKALNNGANACEFADLAKKRKMDLSTIDCTSF